MSRSVESASRRRLLIVEDDPSILMGLRMNLEAEGYEVVVAEDGERGLEQAHRPFDLIILDIMLPGLNGFELLSILRDQGIATPVIVLTARGSEMDTVTGLELGAEDYVTKPFSLAELLARIRVVLRRASPPPPVKRAAWRFGDVVINPETREVTRGGEGVELTRTEFDVLAALFHASGRVLTRQQIFDQAWGPGHHGTVRTVDNFIAQLRAKLEDDPSSPRHLLTVRGVGYRLEI
jgi:DNA-binding response OmpR family regulator